MANPLFNMLGGNQLPGNLGALLSQFNQFKSSFQGDPRQQVQNLLNSGKMSQQQFNQLQAMATQLKQFIH